MFPSATRKFNFFWNFNLQKESLKFHLFGYFKFQSLLQKILDFFPFIFLPLQQNILDVFSLNLDEMDKVDTVDKVDKVDRVDKCGKEDRHFTSSIYFFWIFPHHHNISNSTPFAENCGFFPLQQEIFQTLFFLQENLKHLNILDIFPASWTRWTRLTWWKVWTKWTIRMRWTRWPGKGGHGRQRRKGEHGVQDFFYFIPYS